MDVGTTIGLIGGAALILLAVVLSGSPVMFINAPGMLIVLGGSLATCFIKFSMKDVVNSIKVVMKAFMFKVKPPDKIINRMVFCQNRQERWVARLGETKGG